MTDQPPKWITVEEWKPHSMLLAPFRLVGWLILWGLVVCFVSHLSAGTNLLIIVVLAMLCTWAPKTRIKGIGSGARATGSHLV